MVVAAFAAKTENQGADVRAHTVIQIPSERPLFQG
jgi:hypothetical protein